MMITSGCRSKARRTPIGLGVVLALALLGGACSSGSDSAGSTTTTSSSTTATSSPTTTSERSSTTSAPSITSTTKSGGSSTTGSGRTTTTKPVSTKGCTTGSSVIPAGAVSRQVIDVDGDGKPDTAWLATGSSGAVDGGIATAAGGGAHRSWNSASPVTRSLLVEDINDTTPPVLLADDGRTVQLWTFDNCAIVDVKNAQGNPYTFSLGFTEFGTGVGCASVGGRNELVGLNATTSSDGKTVDWSSTVVAINGTKASNGTKTDGTYTSPADDAKIDLLHQVTCGTKTMATDGLTLPQ